MLLVPSKLLRLLSLLLLLSLCLLGLLLLRPSLQLQQLLLLILDLLLMGLDLLLLMLHQVLHCQTLLLQQSNLLALLSLHALKSIGELADLCLKLGDINGEVLL